MQNINIESSQRSSPSVLRHRRTDGSDLSQKKSGLKIYNSMYHNFDYEHHAKQKRTFAEMIADRSTPSNVSEHSIIIHNDGNVHFTFKRLFTEFLLKFKSIM